MQPGVDLRHARIAIVGLGLIGGSLALAVRRTLPHATILGVDTHDVMTSAQAAGTIDQARASVGDLVDADVIVLATPIAAMPALLADIAAARLRGLVTDVGSTKRHVLAAAARVGVARFVGGHPMAGAEHGGLAHARADLFNGRPWLIASVAARASSGSGAAGGSGSGSGGGRGPTPGAPAPPAHADVAVVESLALAAGATPRHIDAEMHDRLVAYVSHVPQLMAVALMATVGAETGAAGLDAAGRGLMDMTRLASSPANVWQDILATNADFIDEALAAVATRWPSGTSLMNADWVRRAFADAAAWRARLLELHPPIH